MFTVTLSDATAGSDLAGTLTIPTNDPAGPFVLRLRGDVTAKPEVRAVARLADAGGRLIRDATGDGLPDALYGNGINGRVGLLTNDGTGVLRTAAPSGPDAGTFTFGTGGWWRPLEPHLAAGDFNRDGLADFVRARTDLRVFLGTPGGGYRPGDTVGGLPSGATQPQGTWVQVGDLNRDGNPDLLVGNGAEALVGRVWFGNGDGTFRAGADVAQVDPNTSTRGVLADVNRDGNLDLVGTAGDAAFAVWFGDGTGGLAYDANAKVTVTGVDPIYTPLSPNVTDVTGDGIPDVVVTRYDAEVAVVTYPGRGNVTFGTPVVTSTGSTDPGLIYAPWTTTRTAKPIWSGTGIRPGTGLMASCTSSGGTATGRSASRSSSPGTVTGLG